MYDQYSGSERYADFSIPCLESGRGGYTNREWGF